jgi:predicted dehydrogenase
MEQVGAAVVGAGHWGERHAYAYHRLPRARLVGICDVDQQRARKLGDRYGADSIYERIDDLLDDSEVEVVSIALPDHLHTEAALSCASRGRHILVEKPLALTVEECETIIEAADAGGVRLMVDFANRWNAPFVKAKELISSGQVSYPRLAHIRLNNTISVPTEMLGWSSNSSVLWWIGSHAIDLARWLFDDEVETVSSVAGWGRLQSLGIDTADFYVTTLRFRNGGVAVIENCWILPNARPGLVDFTVEIVSDTGMLTMDTLSHRALEHINEGGIYRPDFFYDYELGGSPRGAFIDAVSHFVESVRTGNPPNVTGRDGVEATRIILAALASAERGVPVHLDSDQLDGRSS